MLRWPVGGPAAPRPGATLGADGPPDLSRDSYERACQRRRSIMGTVVTYQLHDAVAAIAMDDGKVNVLSPAMLAELDAPLDRAEADRAVVVLTCPDGRSSARSP